MYNNNDTNNENNNNKLDPENIIGALWINKGKNGGVYLKGKMKLLDKSLEIIKDENGKAIDFNVIIFYNKKIQKMTDPNMLIYKPDRSKYEGKDYDKYKNRVEKNIEFRDNAINKTKIKEKEKIKKKVNEDELKKLDI
jgi:hypothetical protein